MVEVFVLLDQQRREVLTEMMAAPPTWKIIQARNRAIG